MQANKQSVDYGWCFNFKVSLLGELNGINYVDVAFQLRKEFGGPLNRSKMGVSQSIIINKIWPPNSLESTTFCSFVPISLLPWILIMIVLDYIWERGYDCVFKSFKFFFIKIEYDLYVLNCFDVLISKIIF
jgi:hypothetical protein